MYPIVFKLVSFENVKDDIILFHHTCGIVPLTKKTFLRVFYMLHVNKCGKSYSRNIWNHHATESKQIPTFLIPYFLESYRIP